jgi:RNA polymerase sigma-70 factor (ECF subfamily)
MYPTRVAGRITSVAAGEAETERHVIEDVLRGRTASFRVLVERYQRGVHAVIFRLVHSPADADDLTQQAFLSAYDALADFKLELRFSSWLYRIAVNLAKDHLKSKKRGELGTDEIDSATDALFSSSTPATDQPAERAERQRLLERALARLSIADREVLILKDIEELSYDEMKQILGRPVTALKIRVVRARQRLKAQLDACAGKGAL